MMDGQRQMMNRKKKNVKTFVSSERKNQTPVTTRAPLKEKNITLDALNGNNLRRGLQKDVGSKNPDSENQLVGRRNKLKLARFDNDGPNANGTFSGPWRFNCEYITRNPHFVVVKPNALPSVNQKAILDHTFVEEVEKDCEYIKPSSPKRSQQSIRKYLKLDDKENSCSFFDGAELSPIRIRENSNSVRELDTSSKSPTKTPLDIIHPHRCYVKNRRKKRLRSVDYDDNEIKNTRKKHKEKENPELEKWAKEFNSMCEEINKDQLEIE